MNRTSREVEFPPLALRASLRWDVVDRMVNRLKPQTVLEIGCGQGAVGARLASRAEYVGVEPDRASYAVARSRIHPLGGLVLNGTVDDVEQLRTFDLVCAFEVLEHIQDDQAALEGWRARLAPDGHLLISVPSGSNRFGPMDELAGHFRRYDKENLEDVARRAGLEVEVISFYGWPLSYALEGVRNWLDARRLRRLSALDIEARTAASGRTFQPGTALSGMAIRAGTWPFKVMQRSRPERGTGLLMVATAQG